MRTVVAAVGVLGIACAVAFYSLNREQYKAKVACKVIAQAVGKWKEDYADGKALSSSLPESIDDLVRAGYIDEKIADANGGKFGIEYLLPFVQHVSRDPVVRTSTAQSVFTGWIDGKIEESRK